MHTQYTHNSIVYEFYMYICTRVYVYIYIIYIYIFIYASVGKQRATETIKSSILFLEFKNLTYKS